MDEAMMKVGGAAKRKELQRMFAELKISGSSTRDYTEKEKDVIAKGDTNQAENLNAQKYKN